MIIRALTFLLVVCPTLVVAWQQPLVSTNRATTETIIPVQETPNRRHFFAQALQNVAAVLVATPSFPLSANAAAETIGKDPNCNDATCLGVWDGLLADCPHPNNNNNNNLVTALVQRGGAGCASSQDDTPGVFAEPWDYSDATSSLEDWQEQMKKLIPAIQSVCHQRGDDVRIVWQEGRYLRVQFLDGTSGEPSTGEFYFTHNDTTVQFRVSSIRSNNNNGSIGIIGQRSISNLERCEKIRQQLRYTKVPVLRNRQRSFFFGESDSFDTFGPSGNQAAALGPPAEMDARDIDGRTSSRLSDVMDPDRTQGRDALQQAFPRRRPTGTGGR